MIPLLAAHGTDAVFIVLLVALFACELRRGAADRRMERARGVESRNPGNDVGVLARSMALQFEQFRSGLERWRDAIAYATVLAAIANNNRDWLASLLF